MKDKIFVVILLSIVLSGFLGCKSQSPKPESRDAKADFELSEKKLEPSGEQITRLIQEPQPGFVEQQPGETL